MKLVIFGARGQDGRFLCQQALAQGHTVVGVGSQDPANPLHAAVVASLLEKESPDEVYYLAAHHRSSQEAPDPQGREWPRSFEIHLYGWMNVLDAVKKHAPRARVLYASSAHIFGTPTEVPQTESTPLRPHCAYGCSKLAGMEVGNWYRQTQGLFVSHAILYPHESVHRGPAFLSKKLLIAAQEASRNSAHCVAIGDPQAIADWGYAPEYTRSMRDILLLKDPEDFVVSTGQPFTVADFAREIFGQYGLDWQSHVQVDPDLLTKPKRTYVGNSTKLRQATGRKPELCLPGLARQLVHDYRGSW